MNDYVEFKRALRQPAERWSTESAQLASAQLASAQLAHAQLAEHPQLASVDILVPVVLTLHEIYHGAKKYVQYMRMAYVHKRTARLVDPASVAMCPECSGKKYRFAQLTAGKVLDKCAACGGCGIASPDVALVERSCTAPVALDPLTPAKRMVLDGFGHCSPCAAAPGSIILDISYCPAPFKLARCRGNAVLMHTQEISPADALLGTTFRIVHPLRTVRVSIGYTMPGSTKRIPGMGLPAANHDRRIGPLVVQFAVCWPAKCLIKNKRLAREVLAAMLTAPAEEDPGDEIVDCSLD